MVISLGMVIWAMTWATRCEIGAEELTHGQDAAAAVRLAWAGRAVRAPAGTATSAAAPVAASTATTRPMREVARCRARKGR